MNPLWKKGVYDIKKGGACNQQLKKIEKVSYNPSDITQPYIFGKSGCYIRVNMSCCHDANFSVLIFLNAASNRTCNSPYKQLLDEWRVYNTTRRTQDRLIPISRWQLHARVVTASCERKMQHSPHSMAARLIVPLALEIFWRYCEKYNSALGPSVVNCRA